VRGPLGGTGRKSGGLALGGLLGAGAPAACGPPAKPLPPVPSSSGGVLIGVGEAPPIRDGQTVIDRVVAVVNGDVVMMSDLQEAMVLSRRDGRNPSEASDADLERAVLNRLVDHRPQIPEAKGEKKEGHDESFTEGGEG